MVGSALCVTNQKAATISNKQVKKSDSKPFNLTIPYIPNTQQYLPIHFWTRYFILNNEECPVVSRPRYFATFTFCIIRFPKKANKKIEFGVEN